MLKRLGCGGQSGRTKGYKDSYRVDPTKYIRIPTEWMPLSQERGVGMEVRARPSRV